jgi:hypothetical protein
VTTIGGVTTRDSDLLELPRFGVNPNGVSGGTALSSSFLNAVNSVSATGNTGWTASSATPGYYGTGYRYAASGDGSAVSSWSFTGVDPGSYEVFAWWSAEPNRATNAPYTVVHADGETLVRVNQQQNGGQWVSLGTYSFDVYDQPVVLLTNDADGIVIADAIMVERQSGIAAWTIY